LEELESRLAPASFTVNAQLQIATLSAQTSTSPAAPASQVVFFESSVADNEILRQGPSPNTDAVLLDSAGDGLKEMAALLTGRHNLASIGIVAHGSPGSIALGTATLDNEDVNCYARELAAIGSALAPGGELDVWSCNVAAGQSGAALVRDLASATGSGVAAADHLVGSSALGGNWQLNVAAAGARGEVPFSAADLQGFHELLGNWSAAASMATARISQTATLLGNGKVLVAGGAAQGIALASAELYDPVTNTWSAAGSLATARFGQTATLLNNGQVLVTGGQDILGNPFASAELYDPIGNTWSVASPMATARSQHTATLLSNGQVLVTGGFNPLSGGALASAELYDPISNTWSAAGSMANARYDQTATLLANGAVLVAGGANAAIGMSSAELYDPISNTWSAAASLATARFAHTATLLSNGTVLVVGGKDNTALASAEAYDPVSNTWSAAGSLATARFLHTATRLGNGQVLVTGGDESGVGLLSSAELYDPVNNTWSAAGSMAVARDYDTATLLGDGKVLVAGGANTGGNALPAAELYDPHLATPPGTWSPAASMAAVRQLQTATLLGNGNVLVAGGYRNAYSNDLASAEAYDPVSNTWSAAGSMAVARSDFASVRLGNGKVLVVGGADSSGNSLASSELYDPVSNAWTSAGSMATGRREPTATLLGTGQVLVTGGADVNTALASAELYDPISNTWSSAGSMAVARYSHTATLLGNGKVLVAGGQANSSSLASSELYDPVSNTWSAAGSLATARYLHTATLLGNGQVLVAGGWSANTLLASAELYDPISNTWSAAGSMSAARAIYAAALLGDGMVLVTGGVGSSGVLASAELYDPVNNTWSAAGAMANARFYQTATLLGNGKVLIAGGQVNNTTVSSAELYDPSAPKPASQLIISNLSATNVAAGGSVSFTVTAEDSTGTAVPGYTGSIQLTSTDTRAGVNGSPLPVSYTFASSDAGTHTFTVTLESAGNQTITVTDSANHSLTAATSAITVPATFSKFVVNVLGGTTLTAGAAFLFNAQAVDALGNPVSNYNGQANVTISATPSDPQSNWPIHATLDNNGVAYFLGTLKTAGSYTLTATVGSYSATSAQLTVTPSSAIYFKVVAPATATTGSPFNVTVTALDAFGNTAAGYAGKVHFTSTDAQAILPADTTLTNGVGTFSITLKTGGSQTITAMDSVSTIPIIGGTSGAITTRGLVVTSFTPAADGFTATFSKAFDPSKLTLYGSGLATVQDVTLVGAHNGPITGTVYIDPSNQSITFNATESYLESFFSTLVLPDDTYTVTLVSGTTNGFTDGSAPLDGANNAGHANYTTTFTTANQSKTILSLPDFARGPDGAHDIQIPADTGHGIPVTLTNATSVTAALFSLNYNPALLTVSGALSADATTGGTLTLLGTPTIIDATHATANFQYASTTPQSGTVLLGDIVAAVPNSAAGMYKAKELLSFSSISVNGNTFTGVATSAVHVNAYFGDVTGNGSIDALDVATANNVAQGSATGFNAYTLLDPAIIGDVAGDISVDAGDVSTLAAYVSQLPTPRIPPIPTGLTLTPAGPDPTLSLAESGGVSPRRSRNGATINVAVQLDDPHPKGSTGMTEAVLVLQYDPAALSVAPGDVTLGSIPGAGTGWQLAAVVDQAAGRIAVTIYSTTPINSALAGSLVDITFHATQSARPGGRRHGVRAQAPVLVTLLTSATIDGEQYVTQVDDAQGAFVLGRGTDRVALPRRGHRGEG
jgi:N-acetylneuraminic acid mutarotase